MKIQFHDITSRNISHYILSCFTCFSCGKHITFLFQEECPNFAGKLINDHQHIISATLRRHFRWSQKIRMNIIQRSLSVMDFSGESNSLLLPKNTVLTELQFATALFIKKFSFGQFCHVVLAHIP